MKNKPKKQHKKIQREIQKIRKIREYEWTQILIFFVMLYFVLAFVVVPTTISGSSMEPAYSNQDFILIERISVRFSNIQRNDVIVFRNKDKNKDKQYIKRVIGLPGEKIVIKRNGEIYINNIVYEEKIDVETMKYIGDRSYPVTIDENTYFVLGDNRNNSKDSRNIEIGLVNEKEIVGVAYFRLFPFRKAGKL